MVQYTITIKFPKSAIKILSQKKNAKDISDSVSSSELSLNLNNNYSDTIAVVFNDVKAPKGFDCTITSLEINKRVYQPSHVVLKMLFKDKENVGHVLPGSIFKGCYLDIKKGSVAIVQNYPIFSLSKVRNSQTNGTFEILFDAYSPDQFLTMEKYSRAYTGFKFYGNLINVKQKTCILSDGLKQMVTDGQIGIRMNFRSLRYKKSDDSELEYIHPYLVQYNESPYDFIVRTLNRCGEFFYYESGFLVFGWVLPELLLDKASKTDEVLSYSQYCSTVKNYSPIEIKSFSDVLSTESLIDPVDTSFSHPDYSKENSQIKGFTKQYDLESAYDENLIEIADKNSYTTWQEFALFPGPYWISLITGALEKKTIAEMMTFLGITTTLKSTSAAMVRDATNDAYEKVFFTKPTPPSTTDSSKTDDDASKKKNYNPNNVVPNFDDRIYKSKEKIKLYSTSPDMVMSALADDATPILGCQYFGSNLRKMESAERGKIHLALGSDNAAVVLLGSLVYYDDKVYVVVDIKEDCFTASCVIEALPTAVTMTESAVASTTSTSDETKKILKIDGIDSVYPPLIGADKHIRKCGAQRAIVASSMDPLRMNRVRILYPWQGEKDTSSPWIRVAVPMASKGAGFNFLPNDGDEVIVNYENGNIERPYVEGMVYNEEHKGAFSHKRNLVRTLTSSNGHSMIFNDPAVGSDILQGLSPLWGTIRAFGPGLSLQLNETAKKMGGGIEFTDENGLYSLSMSSDKRAISINSPLGKVDINAFTGITISAPNGNVKIEGKNVEIVAGNNLTLTSGANIAPYLPRLNVKSIIKTVTTPVVGLAKLFVPIDMVFVRTTIECFLRPIGGRLLVKSNRFLCLEAGKGETKIPHNIDKFMESLVDEMQKVADFLKRYNERCNDKLLKLRDSCEEAIRIYNFLDANEKMAIDVSQIFDIENIDVGNFNLSPNFNGAAVRVVANMLNDLEVSQKYSELGNDKLLTVKGNEIFDSCVKDAHFVKLLRYRDLISHRDMVLDYMKTNDIIKNCTRRVAQCEVHVVDKDGNRVSKTIRRPDFGINEIKTYLFNMFKTILEAHHFKPVPDNWDFSQGQNWNGRLLDVSGPNGFTPVLAAINGILNTDNLFDDSVFKNRTPPQIIFSSKENETNYFNSRSIEQLTIPANEKITKVFEGIQDDQFPDIEL